MNNIVVFGTIVIDRMRTISRWPNPGEFEEASFEKLSVGGEASNTALVLRKWENAITILGNPLGEDALASLIFAKLNDAGIDTTFLQRNHEPTPVCDIFVTPDGERTMIGRGWPGFDATLPDLTGCRWFTADRNIEHWALKALSKAKNSGSKILMMDFAIEEVNRLCPQVWQTSTDWIGIKNGGDQNLSFLKSLELPTETLAILTDGENGLGVSLNRKTAWIPAYLIENFEDATGCGDSFRAGILHGMNKDWPISQTLAFASAAAGLSGQSFGATERVPSEKTILEFTRMQTEVTCQITEILSVVF